MNRTMNIGYLVTGLVFIGLAASWGLHANGVIKDDGFQWFLPAMLLGAGLIGLFASLGKGLVGRKKQPQPTYSDDTTTQIDTEGTNS
jgi:hypothetical protein